MATNLQQAEGRTSKLDPNRRSELYVAVSRYIHAQKALEQARDEYNEACQGICSQLEPGDKYVTKVDFSSYLILCNSGGGFSVEKVESI